MRANGVTPILNVSDLQQSFAWFEKLGWNKNWAWGDPADFGAVGSGECEIFLCQDCQGGRGAQGVWMSIWVDDVDAVHRHCVAQGIEVAYPPADQEWNVREMHVRHPDGHMFRISQGIGESSDHAHDAGPPLVIERVTVPMRLEARLAALLADLAEHKGMSLTSCLEETLLHTLDGVGPHTSQQLEHIQQLKQKHGIDYDSHGSYRFVER